jgi:hypothetical protein
MFAGAVMAKQKTNFARVTISVSSAVRTAMKKRKGVNWSKVAERAFQSTLTNPDFDLSLTIERLRASKAAFDGAEYQEGRRVGLGWASSEAEYDELIRLEKLHTHLGDRWDESFDDRKFVSDKVLNVTGEFWKTHLGDEIPSDKTVRGFWEGALEVFRIVKDQL